MPHVDVSKSLERAREAVERRNYGYAMEILRSALKVNPEHVQARRDLRMVEMRLAQERGASFFAKTKVLLLTGKAWALLLIKKYESAMESAEDALAHDPTNAYALMALGRAAHSAGHKECALSVFEDIRGSKASGHPGVMLRACRELAYTAEELGRVSLAKDVWEQVRKLHPADPDADSRLRNLYAREMIARTESAVAGGQRGAIALTMAKNKDDIEKQSIAETDIRTEEDVRKHIELTREEVRKRPDDARLHAKLGDLHLRLDEFSDAKRAYEEAIARDPQNPQWNLIKMDDLEIRKGRRELDVIEKRLKEGDSSAREDYQAQHLAWMELRLKSFLEREKQYPTNGRIRYELGSVYFDMARLKRDNALYDQAIMRYQFIYADPKYRHEAGLRLGQSFAAKGQYDLALKRLEETLRTIEVKNLTWKTLMYARADVLERGARKPDALRAFLEIYELDVAFQDVAKRVEKLQKEGVKPA